MTLQEFVEKFQPTRINDNCLRDLACPACGHRETLRIECTVTMSVTDDGTSDPECAPDSGFIWEPDSNCECDHCQHFATVADFTVDGLDTYLLEKEKAYDDDDQVPG